MSYVCLGRVVFIGSYMEILVCFCFGDRCLWWICDLENKVVIIYDID